MLATNTYCSGSHGDHSHPTLDQGKSYSRFTPLFRAWHKSCVRGWDNGERRHYIKTNETANQTNMQNRHLYFFFTEKIFCFVKREWFRMYWPRLLFKDFGWDMIKNIKEISIVSNKTMLITRLKISSLGHLAVVENWITGLDHVRDCVRNGSVNCVFKWAWEPLFPFIVI